MSKDNKKISRRRFLAYSTSWLVGLTGAVIGGAYFLSETEANRLVKEFAEEIPGAVDVRKYRTPEAKYCLVHILQKHYIREDLGRVSNDVKELQRDIYQILSYLIEKYGLHGVYNEGFTSDIALGFNENVQNILKSYKELLSLESRYGSKILEDAELRKKIYGAHKAYTNVLQEVKSKGGAVERLVLEEKIIIKNAETLEANIAASEDKNKGVISEKVLDDREDILLKLIANYNDRIAVAVYGGMHAWGGKDSCGQSYSLEGRFSYRDNIYHWNKEHSDKKFSLIEIVPKSLWQNK